MNGTKPAGGPTQDEIVAVSLFKMGLRTTDSVLEIGCGTGRVTIALAQSVKKVYSIDLREEAVAFAARAARDAGAGNIEFFCTDASKFLERDIEIDCAFVGGTKNLGAILPLLAKKVRRTIVINAVMVSTLQQAVSACRDLGIFTGAVQVQVSRSHDIAGSIMFRPIDPVYIITARGAACS